MKNYSLWAFLVLLAFPLWGQNTAVRSLTEERRDTIKYGLESDIIELLSSLKAEKNTNFVSDFAELLENSPSPKTVQEIFGYFGALGVEDGASSAEKYLENHENEQRDTIIAALRYLGEAGNSGFSEKAYPLLDSPTSQISSAAVRYVGKKGSPEGSAELMRVFKKEDTSQHLRGEIILALGEMKDKDAVPFLLSLLDDDAEDMTLRRYACDSLGKIGDEEALPGIKEALASEDNILRAYAISAIGHFPGKENSLILVSALRDNFPRVRELAAERLGEREYSDAVDILIYRARRDPEKRVRQAAIKSLSKIGTGAAVDFLQEFLEDDKSAADLRGLIAEELTGRHPSAMKESAAKIMDKEWTREKSPMLDAVCKLISQKEYSGFGSLYERMLDHPSFIIQIYGVRGIQKNRVSGMKDRIKELSGEGRHPQLRRNALSALEEM